MDKINNAPCLSIDEVLGVVDDFNANSVVPIDQSYGLESNINPATGFPFTDIQLVLRASNLAERNTLMDNLQSNKPDFLDDNTSEESAIESMFDKTEQLPSEVIEHQQKVLRSKIDSHNREVVQNKNDELYEDFMKRTSPVNKPKEE